MKILGSDWQPNVELIQSIKHQSRSQNILGSILNGSNFLMSLSCFSLRTPLLAALPNLYMSKLGKP